MEAQEALAAQNNPAADTVSVEGPVYDGSTQHEIWFAGTGESSPEYTSPQSEPIREEPSGMDTGPSARKGAVDVGAAIDAEIDKPLIDPEKPTRGVDTGVPDKDEWLDFFSRIVLKVGLELYTDFAFRGIDEGVVSDADLRRIAVSKDERNVIARPFAEYSTKNKFMRKHGREIVAFADSLESIITLGIWMRKVNRIASKYRPRKEQRTRGSVKHEHHGSNERVGESGEPINGTVITPTIYNPGSG